MERVEKIFHGGIMKLSAPKKLTFIIALVVGVLGIVANFVAIPVISPLAFWMVVVGFLLLVIGTYFDGI